MLAYLPYYLPFAIQCLTALGFVLGGDWVYTGILSFPILAIIDSALPPDMSTRKIRNHFWANVPVWLCTVAGPALYLFAAWGVAHHDLSGYQLAGTAMSCAWLSVIPLVPSAHELYHQRGALRRFVGRYSQVCYLDCMREIAHVVGHHIDVCTPKDSDTAVRGMSLYGFTPRAVIESTRLCIQMEGDALEKRGKGRWALGHRLYKAILAQLAFQTAVFLIGGLKANLVALSGMVIARLWVESFNYFQHYGLIRVEGAPIARRHVWNHLGPLSRLVGWEITNHADHHLDSFAPYYKLVPDRTAVRMPSVFVCFLAALIPPVWDHMIIRPALKRWDRECASAEELKLARVQNEAAGWPNWFDDIGARAKTAAA